jgi:deoxyuridine 5'-triphosphate nucleotidohydrolase
MIEVIVLDKQLYGPEDIMPKTLGSAGLDLKLTRDAKSAAQMAAEGAQWPYYDLIGTGLKVRVPTNMAGLIVPRSSAGHKHGFHIGNTIGIIDSDYRGELMMSIGGGDYGVLKRGATVAQIILVPYSSFYAAKIVDEFSDTTLRGEGGYGSTDAVNMTLDADLTSRGFGTIMSCKVPSIAAVEQVLIQSREWVELAPTQRGVCGDARHQTSCELTDEYQAPSQLNGGF